MIVFQREDGIGIWWINSCAFKIEARHIWCPDVSNRDRILYQHHVRPMPCAVDYDELRLGVCVSLIFGLKNKQTNERLSSPLLSSDCEPWGAGSELPTSHFTICYVLILSWSRKGGARGGNMVITMHVLMNVNKYFRAE